MQIGIGIVMLEGWKRWAAAIIAIFLLSIFLAAMVLCFLRGARQLSRVLPFIPPAVRKLKQRFGRRGYQKVQTEEDIRLEFRGREDSRYQGLA